MVWSFDEHPGRFANGKLLLYYWLGLFELPPISALWIARTAIALASLLTGAAVYAIARVAGGAGAGALALAAYAVLPLAFFFERMALADPFAAMFAALAVWQSVRFAQRPTVRAAIAVGVLCAAATLAKLTTGLVPLIPLAAALACFPPRGNNRSVWWYEWRRRYGTGIALAWGIVVLCWLPVVVPAAVAQVRGDPFTLVKARTTDLGEPLLAELRAAIRHRPVYVRAAAGGVWRRADRAGVARPAYPSLTWAAALIAWTVRLAAAPVASRNVRTRYFCKLAAPLSVTATRGCCGARAAR